MKIEFRDDKGALPPGIVDTSDVFGKDSVRCDGISDEYLWYEGKQIHKELQSLTHRVDHMIEVARARSKERSQLYAAQERLIHKLKQEIAQLSAPKEH